MKKLIAVLLIAVLTLGAAGCKKAPEETGKTDDPGAPVTVEEQKDGAEQKDGTTEQKDSSENKDGAEQQTQAAAEPLMKQTESYDEARREFAYTLFSQCYEQGGNTLVSPTSVQTVLALVANGAEGVTYDEIKNAVLGGRDVSEANDAVAASENDEQLKSANAVWLNSTLGFELTDGFEKTAREVYGAKAKSQPFGKDTVKDINGWVSDNTDGMIDSIIGELQDDEQAVLVNAIAFDAKWEHYYKKTRKADFTNSNGKKIKAEYMVGNESVYLDDGKATGFIKPYEGGKYAFAALLPNEGVDMGEYVASLSPATLESQSTADIIVNIPMINLEYTRDLGDTLKSMGLEKVFGSGAELGGLGKGADGETPSVSSVIHKAFIDVDAEGTRAAAVAASNTYSIDVIELPSSKYVTLDRPFVYMIIELDTNVPVFIGVADNLK